MKTRSINSTNLNTGLDDPKQYLSSISNSNFEGEIWNLTLSNGSVKLDFSLIFNTIVDISNNNNCHSFEKILYDLKVIILKLIELNPKTNPTQSHYTGIILTLKFLSERKINTISKDNLADFFSYSLFKSSNNGIIQKRLKVIGHATMNNRHNLLLISNISKNNLGYYLLYCSKITEKHIEKSLENALDKSTKGMLTFHDWKEGGSFNFLTLDYGKYYIDHCRNFFKDNLPEAFAISKTLDNAREIVKISGLNRNGKEIKDFIIPILSNFLSGVSVDNLPKSYKEEDVLNILKQITGEDYQVWWQENIQSTTAIDFSLLLAKAGLEMSYGKSDDDKSSTKYKVWTGLKTKANTYGLTVSSVEKNSPAWHAAMTTGDVIVAIDGLRMAEKELDNRLKDFKPKQNITITYFRRDKLTTTSLELAEIPKNKLKIIPMAKVSTKQKAFFKAWTGVDFPQKK